MKKILILLFALLLSVPCYADYYGGEETGGGTECSTASCDLHVDTTLDEKGICLADGTNCPSAGAESDPVYSASQAANITAGHITTLNNTSGTNTGDQTDIIGNAGTSTALAANGDNCPVGQVSAGVDASGAAEGCVDVWTEAENTAAGYGTGDVIGPATNTDNYIPQWNGANSKTLKDGIPTSTFLLSAGTDIIKDSHIDWGTGANQVSTDDIPEGSTNKFEDTKHQICFIIDGGGSAVTTGTKNSIRATDSFTIGVVEITADQSGSCVVDIWKDTYANYPPDNADSICDSGTCPTLSTAIKNQDTTLTDWTTSISAGDYLTANVDSCSTSERVMVCLYE